MDDLTRIKGVGAATAKKLTEAGITSFAALAQMNAVTEPMASIAQTPGQAAAWIAAAAELAETPTLSQEGANTPPESGDLSGLVITAGRPKYGLNEFFAPGVKERPVPAGDGDTVITVIGPSKGLRRAGRLFGSTPSTIRVTEAELKLIKADPGLSVSPGDAGKATANDSAPATRLTLADCLDGEGQVCAIRVLGPASGRRRGGYGFGATAVTVTPSKEALEQILGDAELSVALA